MCTACNICSDLLHTLTSEAVVMGRMTTTTTTFGPTFHFSDLLCNCVAPLLYSLSSLQLDKQ